MNISIDFNPTGKCLANPIHYNDMLGMLPQWLDNDQYEDKTAKEALDAQYCCGLYNSSEVVVSEEGLYMFPGDPTLYPIVKIKRKDETIYIYEYALVAIIDSNGNSFATRID